MRIKRLSISLLTLVLFVATGSWADVQQQTPQDLISSVTKITLNTLKSNEKRLKKEPSYLDTIIDQHIIQHLDFIAMSKLVLAKTVDWKSLNDSQQEEFVDQFKRLLVRTYTKSLREYSSDVIEFLPFSPSSKPDKLALVKSEIKRSSGSVIPIDYKLRYKDSDGWKVYDIIIEDVSLVSTYHGSFAREVNQHSIDHLIESLKQNNQKPENVQNE